MRFIFLNLNIKKKVVSQKLVDDANLAKLEAERDNAAAKNAKRLYKASKSNVITTQQVSSGAKTGSNVNKYLDKVYGKGLLEQIKAEKLEEKNRRLREEIERKKQLEFEKEKRKQQTRLVTNMTTNSKSKKNVKTPVQQIVANQRQEYLVLDPQGSGGRPAFVTLPLKPYRNNFYQ